jgi:hypothetical protein
VVSILVFLAIVAALWFLAYRVSQRRKRMSQTPQIYQAQPAPPNMFYYAPPAPISASGTNGSSSQPSAYPAPANNPYV